MPNQRIGCGYSVYKSWVSGGLVVVDLSAYHTAVHNRQFIPRLMNSFYTQFCTPYFDNCIWFDRFIHLFHTTYNNHSFLNETNL